MTGKKDIYGSSELFDATLNRRHRKGYLPAILDARMEFWLLQGAVWASVSLCSILVGSRFGLDPFQLAPIAMIRGLSGCVFSTLILRPWLRKLLATKRSLITIAFQMAAVCSFITLLENTIILSFFSSENPQGQLVSSKELIQNFMPIRLVAYLGWCGGYIAIRQWILRRENEYKIAKAEAAMAKAELEMLRAQVDPHFIFNALNSVLAVADDPHRTSSMIQSLCRHLRNCCETSRENHRLSDEFKAVENYIDIEQFRFEQGLQFKANIDPASLSIHVPAGCLLIPVENAIKHGGATSPRPLRVQVNAQLADEQLKLAVANTGCWRAENPDHNAVGMKNLTEILSKIFGDLASVSVTEPAGQVVVNITLPASP